MIVESRIDADGIRAITLNRPPANAINHDMRKAIYDAFIEADRDWNTRVVIFDSSVERFYSAGMDIKDRGPDPASLPPAVPQYGSWMGREVFLAISNCGVPVTNTRSLRTDW